MRKFGRIVSLMAVAAILGPAGLAADVGVNVGPVGAGVSVGGSGIGAGVNVGPLGVGAGVGSTGSGLGAGVNVGPVGAGVTIGGGSTMLSSPTTLGTMTTTTTISNGYFLEPNLYSGAGSFYSGDYHGDLRHSGVWTFPNPEIAGTVIQQKDLGVVMPPELISTRTSVATNFTSRYAGVDTTRRLVSMRKVTSKRVYKSCPMRRVYKKRAEILK